ncbi:competence type IV pilus assembly protein ComGB [Salinicoccus sp. HZC-1]|uniref:competence type IV pilus assembly protein ComGB n=1 Tax=Salinicoccus sp. HZC-1 TaxID=3385497 RepID=UPI00398B7F7D
MNSRRLKINSNRLGKYDSHFLNKLADLLENGFTMHHALVFLLEQYDVLKEKDKKDCLDLVDQGASLSSILKRLGYKNAIIIQISFAEIHGEMLMNLRESASYLEHIQNTSKKLIKAVQYPLVLISIFIIMLVILNYTVIPQFNSLYSAMGTSSQGMVTILTHFLQLLPRLVFLGVILLIVFALIVSSIMMMKNVNKKCKILLSIPMVRFYFKAYQTYRFSREFGYFINNGLEVKEILDLFNHQTLNEYLKYSSALIEERLMQGETLSAAIEKVKMLDAKLSVFVSHGEQNSTVGNELILFSEYTLERMIMKIENATRKIQPVIFLILGLLIICLYLVIVLPIFQMMATIN